jgi:hypothetical protein
MTMTNQNFTKSRGHLEIIGDYEYYIVEETGDLYRAPVWNVLDRNGYRNGRWEGPAHLAESRMTAIRESMEVS